MKIRFDKCAHFVAFNSVILLKQALGKFVKVGISKIASTFVLLKFYHACDLQIM